MVGASGKLAISPKALGSRVFPGQAQHEFPIDHSEDCGIVWHRGETLIFGGDKQRQLLQLLFAAYWSKSPVLRVTTLLVEVVAPAATGDWAGWDLNVALWTDGAWLRLPPRTGWRTWVEDEGLLLVYDDAGWVGTTPDALQNMALLGLGTTADASNPFSANLAERLETTEKANDVQRRMLEAAARRPRDHHELAERLQDGSF